MAKSESQKSTPKKSKKRMDELQKELAERGRDVWLAGLGALATVEEKGSELFSDLIERGKTYEDKSAKQIKELTENVSKKQKEALEQAEDTAAEAQSRLSETVDNALERFGVPRRSEVDELSKKVDKLSKQIDKLAKSLDKEKAAK